MAGNKKPRKPYQGPARKTPLLYARDAKSTLHLKLVPHQQLVEMAEGTAAKEAWHTVVCRLNLGLTLADRYFPLLKQDLADALASMREVWAQYEFMRRIGVDSEQRLTVGRGLRLTDDMQDQCTRKELSEALNTVFAEAAV